MLGWRIERPQDRTTRFEHMGFDDFEGFMVSRLRIYLFLRKPLSLWKTLFQVLLEVWIRKNFLFSCLVVVDIVVPVSIDVLILNCRFFLDLF